jgi:hypothetical protein
MVLPDTLPEMEEQQPRERAEAEDEVGAEPARARGGDTASGDGAGARFSTSMEVSSCLTSQGVLPRGFLGAFLGYFLRVFSRGTF